VSDPSLQAYAQKLVNRFPFCEIRIQEGIEEIDLWIRRWFNHER
jgi:hypothetical protein